MCRNSHSLPSFLFPAFPSDLDCLNSTIGTNVPLVEAAQTDGALHALSLGFHFLGLNAHGALSAVLPALVLATVLGAGAGGVGF